MERMEHSIMLGELLKESISDLDCKINNTTHFAPSGIMKIILIVEQKHLIVALLTMFLYPKWLVKKKGHGPMQRKLRKERTEKRKCGEAYLTAKNKYITARIPTALLQNCRFQCQKKVSLLNIQQLYQDYRELPSRDAQRRYLTGLIRVKPKDRTRTNNEFVKNRQVKSGNSVINIYDRRGMQPSRNRRSDEDIQFADSLIVSRLMKPNMNLQLLYKLYTEEYLENFTQITKLPLSISVFRNVFNTLNLKFKKPSNDTYKTCDSFLFKIKSSNSPDGNEILKNELRLHQDKTQFHYDSKKKIKGAAMKVLEK
ncbi:hypothetical protein ABEB36_009351 [Hypothenemus hampei]|uniref:Uncharacterized protein n=1 Tax=Hypothenemus hampei TaxID=57062 RepID=A0ABD1EK83_HYPHA